MTEGFFSMGGYGAFVWPCYALAAAILIGFVMTTLRELKSREQRLRELEAQHPGRRRATAAPETETP